MMRVVKRLLCVLMVVTLSLTASALLFGCGKKDDEDTAELKVVKVWLHKSASEEEGRVYKAIEEAFNEEGFTTSTGRKIKMRIEFKNSAKGLSDSINAEIVAGGLPDIVAVDAPNIAAYANSRILTDITSYISAEAKADYVDSVIAQGTVDGKLYALSGTDAPTGLYYNKKLLKQVGYTDDDFGTVENPWTWDDLSAAQTALKNGGKSYKIQLNFGFGGSEGNMYLYSPLVYSAGGSFIGADGKAAGALDSDVTIAGLKMLERFYKAGNWTSSGTNALAFAQEEVAFEIHGPWNVATIERDYKSFKDDYGVMPMPIYVSEDGTVKGTRVAGCGSWGFGVTPKAKDKEAAAKAVEYLTGAFASELLYNSIGTFPTHKSSFESDDFESGPRKVFADILSTIATPRPLTTRYQKVSDAFTGMIQHIETYYGTSDYNLKKCASEHCVTVDTGR